MLSPFVHSFRRTVVFLCLLVLYSATAFADNNSGGPGQIFTDIEQNNRYVDMLSPSDLQELPIGISKSIGNIKYTVAFTKAKVNGQYAELSAFARIELPQRNPQTNEPVVLFFGAEGVKFSFQGGLVGDAELALLGNISIPFNGNKWKLLLKGALDPSNGNFADLTYVKIDCEGFKELGIAADVVFSRELLTPLDAQKNPDPNPARSVSGSFQTIVKDWNDLLVDVSIDPFTLTSNPRFGFTVNHAVFDFSDLRNSPAVQFPDAYNELLDPGNPNLWRGVYIQTLEVVLPPEFKQKGSNERISFGAQNLLIDNYGVSGSFYANNILSIGDGDAGGWAFSVDSFALRLEVNQLKAGYFDGNLKLPISEKTDLHYTAAISENNYLIAVQNNKPLDFDVWKARLHLAPNSTVQLSVQNGKFKPKAILNGYMAVSLSDDPQEETVDTTKKGNLIPKLTFQNLTIQTEAPYFQVQAMGYEGEIKFGNFPISLNNINVSAVNDEIKLGLGINLNLMSTFSASGGIGIVGKIIDNGGRKKWKYDHLSLDRIGLKADLGAVKIEGDLMIMKNDPVYGNGFNAHLALEVTAIKLKVSSQAIFGNVGYRYWMVDGLVEGLNVPIGPIKLTGFGGGVSQSMKRLGSGMPVFGGSGLTYAPDSTLGLGLKATVLFQVGTETLVNGSIAFELVFNRHGGLNKMGFYGKASVLATGFENYAGGKLNALKDKLKKVVDKESEILGAGGANALNALGYNEKSKLIDNLGSSADAGSGSIEIQLGIEYDFQNKVLHATSEMYVNLLGGILKGRGPNGRAGWSVLHVEPGTWYMQIGTPSDRLGIRLGIGSIAVEAGGYFMMGDNMPASPPPPKVVADILGVDAQELDYTRDLSALTDGRGVAFGADFSITTGDMTFLIFYANFGMGAGFDIMLRDYGDAHCQGSSEPVGVNGWYANGQSYAYMQGELGIKIKLLFINKKIPIIKGAAAVLLQARLPNPSWFRGYLGGNYNLLGGLIEGSFRFKVELGDKCEIVSGNGVAAIDVISDLKPADNAGQVDVFAAPQATFNMKVNKNFVLADDNGSKTYYIKLDKFDVTKNGQPIQGELEWNTGNDLVTFRSFDVLPPESQLTATVKVAFYEIQNGAQVPVYVNGQLATEEKQVQFTTGIAPPYIPLTNVAHCYPVVEQKNLYPQERHNGYIQLKQGQPYLFEGNYSYEAQFIAAQDSLNTAVTYVTSARKVQFNLPTLANNKAYVFRVVSKSAGGNTSTVQETTTQSNMEDGNSVSIKNKTISGTATNENAAAELISYTLKTSNHNTFAQKLQAISRSNDNINMPLGSSDVLLLSSSTDAYEPFDIAELTGTDYSSGALAQVKATLEDSYYQNNIYPLVYQHYPVEGNITITGRDPLLLGVPPQKAVPVMNAYRIYTQQDIWESYRKTTFPYQYELSNAYKQDFLELRYKVVNQLMGTPAIASYQNLVSNVFPLMNSGNYKVELQYRFPDGQLGTKGYFQFHNPIN